MKVLFVCSFVWPEVTPSTTIKASDYCQNGLSPLSLAVMCEKDKCLL